MSGGIRKCFYGGGSSCQLHGGDGSGAHAGAYTHPYATVAEVGAPVEDPVQPTHKGDPKVAVLPGLEDFFDEDLSKAVLSLSFEEAVDSIDLVRKSLYEFDLDTDEGVLKLLDTLPILDSEIMRDLAQEVWPGYQVEDVDPLMLRAELRGYMMDWLDEQGDPEKRASAPQ